MNLMNGRQDLLTQCQNAIRLKIRHKCDFNFHLITTLIAHVSRQLLSCYPKSHLPERSGHFPSGSQDSLIMSISGSRDQ